MRGEAPHKVQVGVSGQRPPSMPCVLLEWSSGRLVGGVFFHIISSILFYVTLRWHIIVYYFIFSYIILYSHILSHMILRIILYYHISSFVSSYIIQSHPILCYIIFYCLVILYCLGSRAGVNKHWDHWLSLAAEIPTSLRPPRIHVYM